jgi:2-iminobutanoate/2-iminopropanoate deaminase
MPRQALQPEGLPKPKPPYSPVVIAGEMVYTAGQLARDASGDIEQQTRECLENVRTCLEAAGCTLDDVVKVSAFLTDLSNLPGYNAVYETFFSEPYPARTSVGAALAGSFLVEIEAVARKS